MLLLTLLYRGKDYDTLLSKTMQLESISPGIQVWSLSAGLCYCHVLCEVAIKEYMRQIVPDLMELSFWSMD